MNGFVDTLTHEEEPTLVDSAYGGEPLDLTKGARMEARAVVAALRELEGRGWPVEVAPKTGISDSPHIRFVEPQAGHIGGLNITLHKPLPWDAEALLNGWLVTQLKAQTTWRSVVPFVPERDISDTHWRVFAAGRKAEAPTELGALLELCLALAPGSAAPEVDDER